MNTRDGCISNRNINAEFSSLKLLSDGEQLPSPPPFNRKIQELILLLNSQLYTS